MIISGINCFGIAHQRDGERGKDGKKDELDHEVRLDRKDEYFFGSEKPNGGHLLCFIP